MKSILNFLIFFVFTFLSGILHANKSVNDSINNELKEILITATKTERKLSSIPVNASIIKKIDIQKTNATKLSDIINEEAGLITISDFGGSEGIQMQGLDSQYTLILIDNQPLIGRSAGTLDLDRISVGNIKQIEIVRGASSSLYGNEALAGVINIITDDAKMGFNGTFSSSYETHNSFDNNIIFDYRNENFSSSVYLNTYSSDGYDLNLNDELNTVNKFNNKTLQLKLEHRLNENLNLKLNSRYFTQSIDNIASNYLSGETYTSEDNINLIVSHKSKKINTDLEMYFTSFYTDEFLNDQEGNQFSESFYDQILLKPEIKSVYSINNNEEIVFGLGMKHELLERTYFDIRAEQNSPFVYFQYDFQIDEKINLILGGRYDNFKEYKSQFSPKFAGIYKIDENKSVKISLGYGFKAPDFRQLYFNFSNSTIGYSVIGYNVYENVINQLIQEGVISSIIVPVEEFINPLKPESSFSLNIGYKHKHNNKINFKSNLFTNITQDLIDTRVVANKTNGQNVFSYYNLNRVITTGLELETNYKYDNYLKFSLGYQLLYAYDLDAINAFKNGEIYARITQNSPTFQLKRSDYFGLFNRSRHMGTFKVNYFNSKHKLDSRLRIRYRSKYGLFDTNGNNYLDKYDNFVKGYFITNLSFNKSINNMMISTGIENLFNYKDPDNITNLSGRLFYLKLLLKINNKL